MMQELIDLGDVATVDECSHGGEADEVTFLHIQTREAHVDGEHRQKQRVHRHAQRRRQQEVAVPPSHSVALWVEDHPFVPCHSTTTASIDHVLV